MLFVETTKFFADYFTFILKILQVPGLFEGVCALLCVPCIVGLPSWYKFPVDFQGVTVVFAKGILSACNTWPFIGQKVAFCNVKGHLSYFVLFPVVFHVLYRCRAAGAGQGCRLSLPGYFDYCPTVVRRRHERVNASCGFGRYVFFLHAHLYEFAGHPFGPLAR